MDITAFRYIGPTIDDIATKFISQTSGDLISALKPVAVSGLTLYITIYGFLIITGRVSDPLPDFIIKSLKWCAVIGFGLAAGHYQGEVVNVINAVKDGLSDIVVVGAAPGPASNMYQTLDTALGVGLQKGNDFLTGLSLWDNFGVTICLVICAVIVWICTAVLIGVAGAYVIMASLMLAVLLGLGPIFITFLLFPVTARFFESWMAQVATNVLKIVLVSACLGFSTKIFQHYLESIDTSDALSVLGSAGAILTVSFVLLIILLNVPAVAAGLGGGVQTGILQPAMAAMNVGRQAVGSTRAAAGATVQRFDNLRNAVAQSRFKGK